LHGRVVGRRSVVEMAPPVIAIRRSTDRLRGRRPATPLILVGLETPTSGTVEIVLALGCGALCLRHPAASWDGQVHPQDGPDGRARGDAAL